MKLNLHPIACKGSQDVVASFSLWIWLYVVCLCSHSYGYRIPRLGSAILWLIQQMICLLFVISEFSRIFVWFGCFKERMVELSFCGLFFFSGSVSFLRCSRSTHQCCKPVILGQGRSKRERKNRIMRIIAYNDVQHREAYNMYSPRCCIRHTHTDVYSDFLNLIWNLNSFQKLIIEDSVSLNPQDTKLKCE